MDRTFSLHSLFIKFFLLIPQSNLLNILNDKIPTENLIILDEYSWSIFFSIELDTKILSI